MNEFTISFIVVMATLVAVIMLVKIFNTMWLIVDKKFHPEKIRTSKTPETAFGELKNKFIDVDLKDGDSVHGMYERTLYFNDGEFTINTCVYFQLKVNDKACFIAGNDIKIIKISAQQV
jgi:hypothetical protein